MQYRHIMLMAGLAAELLFPPQALAAPSKAAIERRARAIEKLLVAPCCFKGTLYDHPSPVADRMRSEIRKFVAEGKGDGEILALYKARYGQAVLAEPPDSGFSNLVLYGLPFGLAAVVLFVLTFLAARRSTRPDEGDAVKRPDRVKLPDQMVQRIEAMVRPDRQDLSAPSSK